MGRARKSNRSGRRKAARRRARQREAGGIVAPPRPSPQERTQADNQRLMAGLRRCGWHSLRPCADEYAEAHRKAMLAEFGPIWGWWCGLTDPDRAALIGGEVDEAEALLWGLRPGEDWQAQVNPVRRWPAGEAVGAGLRVLF
jgi:hypothetical protein